MNAKRPLVAFIAIVSLIFLYIPSIAVAVFSVNNAKFGLAWRGFTWKWYEQLLQNEIILEAALNSLFVALVSTAAATVLGTPVPSSSVSFKSFFAFLIGSQSTISATRKSTFWKSSIPIFATP